jgi:hypothetical protein
MEEPHFFTTPADTAGNSLSTLVKVGVDKLDLEFLLFVFVLHSFDTKQTSAAFGTSLPLRLLHSES